MPCGWSRYCGKTDILPSSQYKKCFCFGIVDGKISTAVKNDRLRLPHTEDIAPKWYPVDGSLYEKVNRI